MENLSRQQIVAYFRAGHKFTYYRKPIYEMDFGSITPLGIWCKLKENSRFMYLPFSEITIKYIK